MLPGMALLSSFGQILGRGLSSLRKRQGERNVADALSAVKI
jgi:hypothetical protein